jgi:hypothetical protein
MAVYVSGFWVGTWVSGANSYVTAAGDGAIETAVSVANVGSAAGAGAATAVGASIAAAAGSAVGSNSAVAVGVSIQIGVGRAHGTAAVPISAWHDPSKSANITQSSGAISADADLSDNINNETQATGANKPAVSSAAINGLDAESFTASSSQCLLSSINYSARTNIGQVWVIRHNNTGAAQSLIGCSATGGLQWRISSTNTLQILAQGSAGIALGATTVPTTTAIVSMRWSNTGVGPYAFHINGTVTDSGNVGGTFSLTSGTSFTGSNGGFSESFDGLIAERVGLDSSTLSDIQRVEGYLAWKWGLVSALDASHPYKNVDPGTLFVSNTASGIGAGIAAGVGSAAGTDTASGIGAAIRPSVGSSAGTDTATAVGVAGSAVQAGVGSSAGSNLTSGISPSVAAGSGTAASVGSNIAAAIGRSIQQGVGVSVGANVSTSQIAADFNNDFAQDFAGFPGSEAGLGAGDFNTDFNNDFAVFHVGQVVPAIGESTGSNIAVGVGLSLVVEGPPVFPPPPPVPIRIWHPATEYHRVQAPRATRVYRHGTELLRRPPQGMKRRYG